MLIYPSPRCLASYPTTATHLCDEYYVEYILPSLNVVMTTRASYKLAVLS